MSTLHVSLGERHCDFRLDDALYVVPVGCATLTDGLAHDPPRPEELTNAIGLVLDHLEDVTRELPMAQAADRVEFAGPGVPAVASVDVGGDVELPYLLDRVAAEDVFRTLVTERRDDRINNPGLPPSMVHAVLGVVSAVVATMRFLQADAVWLVDETETPEQRQ